MGRVKAWYQDILERETEWHLPPPEYVMSIINNTESRHPLTLDEINLLALEAAELDKQSIDN